ncbi:MAG TPA: thioredoxin family protein, partial [Polyangiaceae bacterium]|nr:thioredoxin family protein [Polyangiaceae bacterium]
MRPFALALALACAACHKSAAPPKATIAFVEDDYEGALARAKSEHRPLFVDAWAPWCHTCLSMKAYVFGDPILAPVASKFVWAAIDTEKVKNDAFTRKFEMQAWPTLWVIDSATEKPTLKWLGSVTANELVTLLEAATGNAQATSGASEAAAAWIRGNREVAEQHPESAIVEYRDALARAPASWALRARVVETLILQLRATQQNMDCLNLAHREFATMPRGTSRLDVVLAGVACGE